MEEKSDKAAQPKTGGVTKDIAKDLLASDTEATYRPVPHRDVAVDAESRQVWRVRLEPVLERSRSLGLDVNGDVILGRAMGALGIVDLSPYGAERWGVSRRHALLRPTATKLFVIDQGSTNGTRLNGRSIGVNTPYSLSNGDLLSLGGLEFVVRIVRRPSGHTAALRDKADLGDALAQLAKAITSELDLDEVLSQALEMAMGLTASGETAIWLVDEQTGELFLEAERGIEDAQIKRMRLPVTDTLAGQVIETGKPIRASGESGGRQVKIKTDYLVEALIYVPLALGGVTFGVLAAAHREPNREFSARDERLLIAIADFAAIAIQNSRLYQATESALAELHSTIGHDLRGPVASIKGLAQMLKRIASLDEQSDDFVDRIVEVSNRMLQLIDELLDAASLSRPSKSHPGQCNLADVVAKAIADLEGAALAKSIDLDLELKGTPYPIEGDSSRLYRSVMNLVNNAIKYSPQETKVSVLLTFGKESITIQVQDEGPGIPEDELPRIFDKFFRGKHGTEHKETGMGLGLSIVETTAKAHQGEVVARNAEGGGAVFTITLPASLRAT